ncbi:MAG: RsmB/NOP family class I SAM-dependent RNA methyltransferase [Myxococcaceae bacterium]|nr:RsmB/NOP family class I SAM-dependent RNA methyltransferase [Myxococcaceae bacterium]
MKPQGPRRLREDLIAQACLEAYGSVRHDGRLSDRALDYVLRQRKQLYSTERRAVAERVYALLRRQRLVDFLAEKGWKGFGTLATSKQDLVRLGIARMLEGDTADEVADGLSFKGEDAQRLKHVFDARAKLEKLSSLERFATEASLPDFAAQKLVEEVGDEAMEAAEAMNVRGPLFGRVNTLKATREQVMTALERDEVTVSPTALSPLGVVLETRTNVYSLDAFKQGLFEVQDEGSQLLGQLVDAPPTKVVDACAGAGGKTLQLAAQMKNRGELFALDVDARRLEELKDRTRRADAHNVRVKAISDDDQALTPVSALVGQAHRVLIDAPCSGSGTFRRKPDARYRLTPESLAEHVAIQKKLLERFSPLVRPGGFLVYGTCSFFRDENEAVVEDFLSRHAEYRLLPAERSLGKELAEKTCRDGMLRLFPHRHGTDAFFGAILERKAK